MKVSVAPMVSLVASAGEVAIPVILSRGVVAPLIGDGTAVALIEAKLGVRGSSPCLFRAPITASLVANSAYWSTRLVNRFGSAVGKSFERSSGWLASERTRVASFDQISGFR